MSNEKKEAEPSDVVAPPPPEVQQPPPEQMEPIKIPDEATNILYMGEFDWWVTDIEVEQLVSTYGTVDEVKFLEEKSNGKSTGWVMLKFTSVEGAARCKQKLRNVLVNDKPLTILFSRVGYINHTIINNFKMRKGGGSGDSMGGGGGFQQDGYQRRQYGNFRGRPYRRFNNFNRGGFRRFNNFNRGGGGGGGFRRFDNSNNQFGQQQQQQQFGGNMQGGGGGGGGGGFNQGGGGGGGSQQSNQGGGGGQQDGDRRSGYKRRRDYEDYDRDDDRNIKRERR